MPNPTDNQILVRTSGPVTRDGSFIDDTLNVEKLSSMMKTFVRQIETVLEQVPTEVSKFALTEFTISAEITTDGKIVILGCGVEAGASSGIVFKFEKSKLS